MSVLANPRRTRLVAELVADMTTGQGSSTSSAARLRAVPPVGE